MSKSTKDVTPVMSTEAREKYDLDLQLKEIEALKKKPFIIPEDATPAEIFKAERTAARLKLAIKQVETKQAVIEARAKRNKKGAFKIHMSEGAPIVIKGEKTKAAAMEKAGKNAVRAFRVADEYALPKKA